MRALLFALLVVSVTLWIWGVRRAGRLFTLVIREGKIARSSGRIPPRLMTEIGDIIERAGVTHAKITGIVRDGRPVLQFDGEMSPGTQQQMRNVMGQFSAAEIRNGRRH